MRVKEGTMERCKFGGKRGRCQNIPEINPKTGKRYYSCAYHRAITNKSFNKNYKKYYEKAICKYKSSCKNVPLINPKTGKQYKFCEEHRIEWNLNRQKAREEDPERLRGYGRKSERKLRATFLEIYGGQCSCSSCNEVNERFLSLDHINGGGQKHRKVGTWQVYRDAVKVYQPDVYQILCYNCNMGRAYNGDICPHIALQQSTKSPKEGFIAQYGEKCICCGEDNPGFLCLDHINGGGQEHRNILGSWGIYADAIKIYQPDIYQLMCYNCNIGRHHNGGVCPHMRGIE